MFRRSFVLAAAFVAITLPASAQTATAPAPAAEACVGVFAPLAKAAEETLAQIIAKAKGFDRLARGAAAGAASSAAAAEEAFQAGNPAEANREAGESLLYSFGSIEVGKAYFTTLGSEVELLVQMVTETAKCRLTAEAKANLKEFLDLSDSYVGVMEDSLKATKAAIAATRQRG